jgi:hypothetical protein
VVKHSSGGCAQRLGTWVSKFEVAFSRGWARLSSGRVEEDARRGQGDARASLFRKGLSWVGQGGRGGTAAIMRKERKTRVGTVESMATPRPCTVSVAGPVMPAAVTERVANLREGRGVSN